MNSLLDCTGEAHPLWNDQSSSQVLLSPDRSNPSRSRYRNIFKHRLMQSDRQLRGSRSEVEVGLEWVSSACCLVSAAF